MYDGRPPAAGVLAYNRPPMDKTVFGSRSARLLCAGLVLAAAPVFASSSLRFHGNGGNVDQVRVAIDDPATALPGSPADVGATDFTIELWLRGAAADNTAPAVTCGANANWTQGHLVVDRDRQGADRKFGVSIANGRVVFGV